MTPLAISALVVAIAFVWIVVDDLIRGQGRRAEILTQLRDKPRLGRELAQGKSTRYVLLGKMQDEGIIEVSDLGWEDAPYQYRITERGLTWLREHEAGERERARSGRANR